MRPLFFLVCLLVPFPAAAGNPWTKDWRNLPQLVKILGTVPGGKTVLAAARAKDPDFAEGVRSGGASYTESTFSRTYSLYDGKEKITLRHEVTINRSLNLADAVVDLAHELVHFTEKGMLDPYQPGFELRHFVRNGIEGEGGELAALAVECKVAWELEDSYEDFPQHRLCERYRGPKGFDREAARRDYYALGRWFAESGTLRELFPESSAHAPVFTSSYAGKPYPVALAEEFAMTRRAACRNNERKYRLIAAQAEDGRRPASETLRAERKRLQDYEKRYCAEADSAPVD